MFKKIILKLVAGRTKSYFRRHKNVKLVVVTGSVGKTSTKLAVATVLAQKYRVLVHSGNHNTELSAPLAMLNVAYPENSHNIFAWITVLWHMQRRIWSKPKYQVIVQELGSDKPGDIPHFGTYLHPNVSVVTAVSPEHMEFFKTINAVATEELSVTSFSTFNVINIDDIPSNLLTLADSKNIHATYGLNSAADYSFVLENQGIAGISGSINSKQLTFTRVTLPIIGLHSVKAVLAAVAVAEHMQLNAQEITNGITQIKSVPGRMQVLRGLQQSTLIDDTYNASPLAVEAALKTLYNFEAPQRIAILGSMNELGGSSAEAHQQVGELCDPNKLDWVVTVGDDARKYLGLIASVNGCQVKSFDSPYEAGVFVHSVLKDHAVVLAKGSQNKVFTEEALKVLLHNSTDEEKLVRQTPEWLNLKRQQFKDSPDLIQ